MVPLFEDYDIIKEGGHVFLEDNTFDSTKYGVAYHTYEWYSPKRFASKQIYR